MAHYDDRLKGIKNVTFEEVVANVKNDLRKQLVKIYFKDEPEFVKIIEDDDAYDNMHGELKFTARGVEVSDCMRISLV